MLVDVGPAMHSVLPDVEKTCTLLMQKKVNKIPFSFHSQIITLFCLCYRVSNRALLSLVLCLLLQLIYNKFDEVGIVVFGTQGPSLYTFFIHKCY